MTALPAQPLSIPYRAVVFDMDGVVTDTASVHAAAWKKLFDEVLADPALPQPADTSEFDIATDYLRHVDGRSREDGVRTFLASRGIELPEGDESLGPGELTVASLALRKNTYFTSVVESQGVTVFPGTKALLGRLHEAGIPCLLVTSSRNSRAVLEAAGVLEDFEVVVDGQTAIDEGLAGKPHPAMFVRAVDLIDVSPAEAVVLEDAASGVKAAHDGGFGLVIGISRSRNRRDLVAAGADHVVNDAHEIDLGQVRSDVWELGYRGRDVVHESGRESLTTLANGYMSVRGAGTEKRADGRSYPGAYMSGVVNRLVSHVNGRDLEHESIVNLPRWIGCDLRLESGAWWSEGGFVVEGEDVRLRMHDGVLERTGTLVDPEGVRVRFSQKRLVSMDKQHVAAAVTEFTPENYSGTFYVRTGIDTEVLNDNVAEYAQLAKHHVRLRFAEVVADGTLLCEVETTQSHLRIALAQRTSITQEPTHAVTRAVPESSSAFKVSTSSTASSIHREYAIPVSGGFAISVDTTTALVNSRDFAITSVREGVQNQLEWLPATGFAALLPGHRAAIRRLWDRFGVTVGADAQTQLVINLHTFHLLQTLTPHVTFLDVGTPARGLHGEGYRGHIFWDELFILPLVNLRLPEISQSLLLYRWRRLDAARRLAREHGLSGALFPWQSGSDGREETPVELYNPRSARWMPDNSRKQFHVGLAIAYNAWQHYRATADTGWLANQGGELIVEVTRLFASMAVYDAHLDRYHIEGVMGPDEYHDGYPGRAGSGLKDNAYTNVMTAWVCRHAVEIFRVLTSHEAEDLIFRLDIDSAEITQWARLAARLHVPFNSDGLLSQFEGYDDLKELDWAAYRKRYGNIGRMDLIMESEGDETNNYKLSKQADVTMLVFLLGPEGLIKELGRLGYDYSMGQVEDTIDYYVQRSTDGSSLSNVVNAAVLALIGRSEAWDYWQEALVIDIDDTQWGTTGEGIHLGAMAGTVDIIMRAFSGLVLRFDRIEFHPRLPEPLGSANFRLLFQGQVIDVTVRHDEIRILSRSHETSRVKIQVFDEQRYLDGGEELRFDLDERGTMS